jgi:hypothetical protein
MSSIYEAIGRAVVGYIRYRYGREIRIAAGVGLAALVVGGVFAGRRLVEAEGE